MKKALLEKMFVQEDQDDMKLIERRPYMRNLRDFADDHIIKVVTGMRRCGKSTLFEMFAEELRG
jgi:predicted AAA+ superfamily ATPase